jgi:curved DNA-binding protein CbpA
MALSNYYEILGLTEGCSLNDLKRAYRIKARQYHPDLNHHPDASGLFILATESYEIIYTSLTTGMPGIKGEPDPRRRQQEDYLRQRARERAEYFSKTRYESFTKSSTYRTTRIFDGATIIYGLAISILIIGVDLYSYGWQMSAATTREEEPSLTFMLLLLVLGIGFFSFSYINLLAFIHNSRKKDKNHEKKNS